MGTGANARRLSLAACRLKPSSLVTRIRVLGLVCPAGNSGWEPGLTPAGSVQLSAAGAQLTSFASEMIECRIHVDRYHIHTPNVTNDSRPLMIPERIMTAKAVPKCDMIMLIDVCIDSLDDSPSTRQTSQGRKKTKRHHHGYKQKKPNDREPFDAF